LSFLNEQTLVPSQKEYFFTKNYNFLITTTKINDILKLLKNHCGYQYKVLTHIAGSDYPESYYRFNILYELLSLKYNTRFKVLTAANEITPLTSTEKIYKGASWWESEI